MNNIRLKNFRNIEDSGIVKLRPLTILVGKNGMGKSSLMRLFPLIKQSVGVSKRGPLLWYSEKGVDFGDFSAVVTHGKKNIGIGFSVNISRKDYSFDVDVEFSIAAESAGHNADDISYDYVECLKLNFFENEVVVNYEKSNSQDTERKAKVCINGSDYGEMECDNFLSAIFPIVNTQKEESDMIGFKELVETLSDKKKFTYREPSDFVGVSFEMFKDLLSGKDFRYNVKTVYDNIVLSYLPNLLFNITMCIRFESDIITYIGPFRDAPQRYYRLQNLSTHQIDMSGSNMAVFANAMSAKSFNSFNKMTKSHFDFELKTERHSGHISIKIEKEGKSTNIVDNGFGYSQMMPVLLALHTFTHTKVRSPYQSDDCSQIFCIEQPELHLHPSMQYNMGKTFVDSVKYSNDNGNNNIILVETHSRSFIDAVGDSVVKGDIDTKDVAVYIFDKIDTNVCIELSEFDNEGYLSKWPLGFLD